MEDLECSKCGKIIGKLDTNGFPRPDVYCCDCAEETYNEDN